MLFALYIVFASYIVFCSCIVFRVVRCLRHETSQRMRVCLRSLRLCVHSSCGMSSTSTRLVVTVLSLSSPLRPCVGVSRTTPLSFCPIPSVAPSTNLRMSRVHIVRYCGRGRTKHLKAPNLFFYSYVTIECSLFFPCFKCFKTVFQCCVLSFHLLSRL